MGLAKLIERYTELLLHFGFVDKDGRGHSLSNALSKHPGNCVVAVPIRKSFGARRLLRLSTESFHDVSIETHRVGEVKWRHRGNEQCLVLRGSCIKQLGWFL